MIRIDTTHWDDYIKRMEQRAARASSNLPIATADGIYRRIKRFIERELVIPRQDISFAAQRAYYAQHKRGMFGKGQAPVPPHIIGAQEKMGGADWPGKPKREASFLEGMSGKQVKHGNNPSVEVHTSATMTPYHPEAGPTRPIMHYLRHGWQTPGGGPEMKPRLGAPGQEVAKFLAENNFHQKLGWLVLHWIITGKVAR